MVTVPVAPIAIRSTPFVSNESVFALAAEIPVFVLPVNCMNGFSTVHNGTTNVPVNVPPESGKNDPPVTPTVIVPGPLVIVTFDPAVSVANVGAAPVDPIGI